MTTPALQWYQPFDNGLRQIRVLLRTQLWAQIILALVLGMGCGLLLSPQGGGLFSEADAERFGQWIKLPGSLFLALIQMVVLPLVVSSVMLGVGTAGDPAYLKRIGLRIFPYFVSTTVVAVAIGALLALFFQPGRYIDSQLLSEIDMVSAPLSDRPESVPEKLLELVPTNIIQAALDNSMLQLVIYAMITGIALVALPRKKSRLILQAMDSIQSIAMQIVSWAMMLAPYAVFGLLCEITLKIGGDALLAMSAYVLTVLAGLLLLLAMYVLIAILLGKQKPMVFLKNIRSVQLLAFSTSSSAAVMPLSLKTAEEQLAVRQSVSRFIIPLGATVNMDGTALYQTVAALFLIQVYGIDVSTGNLLLLMITTVGASIGAPSTPGVGIVILATLLGSVGVPASGIALILGVDRILDMSRTVINVSGDLTACCIMNRWLPEESVNQTFDYWQS